MPAFKPLKAHKYDEARISYPCWGQPKLNGLRAVYQNGFFYSGDFERWSPTVVDHLTTPLKETFDTKIILDGEIYVHGWLLQQINSACGVTRLQPNEKSSLVEYHVFDVVNFSRSFVERTRDIFDILSSRRIPSIHPVRPTYLHSRTDADRFYIEQVESGYEGMMYRMGDCPYTRPNQQGTPPENPRARALSDQNNRVWHMLKRKDWHDAEFLIVGMQEGRPTTKGSKRVGSLGSLVCQNIHGTTFGVGIFEGFTEADLLELWTNQDDYISKKYATLRYLTLTEDNLPFNATLIAIRPTAT